MPKRRQILLVLACGMFLVVLYALLRGSDEPSFQGRSLSAWQAAYPSETTTNLSRQQEAVADAIRHMGTNTLPLLLKWIHYERPDWKTRVSSKMPDGPIMDAGGRLMFAQEGKAYKAALALIALGPEAKPAIPELVRIMDDPKSHQTAVMAAMVLAQLGTKEAFQSFSALLTNQHRSDRVMLISMLDGVGTNGLPIVPALLECLKDADPDLREFATNALSEICPQALTNAPPK
jgi:hypothetical protein